MRTLLPALTALMLFATPVVAGDFEDGLAAAKAGDHQKAFRLWKPLAEQGDAAAQVSGKNQPRFVCATSRIALSIALTSP